MDRVAEKIILNNSVTDDTGKEYRLHSHTSREQCEVLQQLIRDSKPKISLEIGFAYGISTLFICEALKEVNAEKHIIIDPFQEKSWKNIGLKNVRDAGYVDLVDFRSLSDYEILPQLLQQKIKIDFAYVDASKVFDTIIINAYYLTKMLNIGGIMVLDDCDWPGIRKACRLLAKHPSFKIIQTFQADKENVKVKFLSKTLPYFPYAKKLFANNLIETDEKLGVNYHCIAFRKVKEDDRNWDWFKDF